MYDLETVKQWAINAMAKEGYGEDYCYLSNHVICTYVEDGDELEPSCIIGHMLIDNGVAEAGALNEYASSRVLSVLNYLELTLKFTHEARVFMDTLQRWQDSSFNTWGKAYEAAVIEVGRAIND